MLSSRRGQQGFSLVETMAALLVFSLITVGMTPLLMSSIRGSAVARSYNTHKNLVLRSLERARGLPYFESVKGATTPTRRDVLDLYFPDRSTGFSSTDNTFTTVCTATTQVPSASGSQACPRNISAGTTLRISSRFVLAEAGLTPCPPPATGNCQYFRTSPPSANYAWNAVTTEVPPTQLVEVTFRADWVFAGRARDYQIVSFFSDRRLAPDNLRTDARIDYTVQAVTSYKEKTGFYAGRTSRLEAVFGNATSAAASRAVASAEQTVRAARILLTREEFNGESGQILTDFSGASRALRSPPNTPAPTTDVTQLLEQYISHTDIPTLGNIAYVDLNRVEGSDTGTSVLNELPKAQGRFRYIGGGSAASFWVTNQIQTGDPNATLLHLDPGQPPLSSDRQGSNRLNGSTRAEATALLPASGRKVESQAATSFARLWLFPTTYIVDPGSTIKSVLKVRNFNADLECTSTANPSTAGVVAAWGASVDIWVDPVNDGSYLAGVPVPGKQNGSYQSIPITGSMAGGAADPLASLGNPLVYDDAIDTSDVYLFKTDTTNGYFQSMSAQPNITWREDAQGRTTTAEIKNALQFVTFRTDPENEATSLTINIGSLGCQAVDRRGL